MGSAEPSRAPTMEPTTLKVQGIGDLDSVMPPTLSVDRSTASPTSRMRPGTGEEIVPDEGIIGGIEEVYEKCPVRMYAFWRWSVREWWMLYASVFIVGIVVGSLTILVTMLCLKKHGRIQVV